MLTRLTSHRRNRSVRRGAAIVESALVLSVFLLLLFGMFEYCRFLLVLHLTNNAARDGARYASVNMDKPSTFGASNYTDGNGKVYLSVQQYTKDRMGGVWKQLSDFKVAVYSVDQTGLDLTPPVIRPKTKSTASPKVYPDPFKSADTNAIDWNSAPFPDRLAVTIKGTYQPALPTFLLMPQTIKLEITAICGGEG